MGRKSAQNADAEGALDPLLVPIRQAFAKDAEVTVVLYVDKTVKVNHAYKPGEFTEQAIPTIIRDLNKILPDKKNG